MSEMDVRDLVRTLNSQSDLSHDYAKRPPAGGSASVGPLDTLGGLGGCWCGEPYNHDWLNKSEGAAHP